MENYYYMPISKTILYIWLAIASILALASAGALLPLEIIPLAYFIILSNSKYYYNDEKMIIETGVLNKSQRIVPLYRIINISAQDNIFNFGNMYIKDKEQIVVLKYIKNSKNEMLKLTEKWENAKKENIRNEII